jgi:hypothetical protein
LRTLAWVRVPIGDTVHDVRMMIVALTSDTKAFLAGGLVLGLFAILPYRAHVLLMKALRMGPGWRPPASYERQWARLRLIFGAVAVLLLVGALIFAVTESGP